MDVPRPGAIDETLLIPALQTAWGLDVTRVRFTPKGFGSFLWTGASTDGRWWFVKVDDLDSKSWLGPDRGTRRHGLEAAYLTAHHLHQAGLEFVVGPLPRPEGGTLLQLTDRYTVAVFPMVEGTPGEWGRPSPPEVTGALVKVLARLHGAARAVGSGALSRGGEIPRRRELDSALDDLDRPWPGGPFSEPARRELRRHAGAIRAWLAALGGLAEQVGAAPSEPVVTHGEPHPGNVLRSGGDLRLIDWDTVALAPPERDMWMLADNAGALRAHEQLSGRPLDRAALDLYALQWALSDLAEFTALFRGEHGRNRVTEKSWVGLQGLLHGSEPAPYGTPLRADR